MVEEQGVKRRPVPVAWKVHVASFGAATSLPSLPTTIHRCAHHSGGWLLTAKTADCLVAESDAGVARRTEQSVALLGRSSLRIAPNHTAGAECYFLKREGSAAKDRRQFNQLERGVRQATVKKGGIYTSPPYTLLSPL